MSDKAVLKVWRGEDGNWWLEHPVEDEPPMGPYSTKAEAMDDKRGIERTVNSAAWRSL